MFIIFFNLVLIMILCFLFFLFGKSSVWEETSKSVFECGFTSYFFSRLSFPIHYFLIGLTFLFLDLELCFLMPFFNEETKGTKMFLFFLIFSLILTLGLILEWGKGMLEWKE